MRGFRPTITATVITVGLITAVVTPPGYAIEQAASVSPSRACAQVGGLQRDWPPAGEAASATELYLDAVEIRRDLPALSGIAKAVKGRDPVLAAALSRMGSKLRTFTGAVIALGPETYSASELTQVRGAFAYLNEADAAAKVANYRCEAIASRVAYPSRQVACSKWLAAFVPPVPEPAQGSDLAAWKAWAAAVGRDWSTRANIVADGMFPFDANVGQEMLDTGLAARNFVDEVNSASVIGQILFTGYYSGYAQIVGGVNLIRQACAAA